MNSHGYGVFTGMLKVPEKLNEIERLIWGKGEKNDSPNNPNLVNLLKSFFVKYKKRYGFGSQATDSLYSPHFYRSFGNYQLHVFALTDDFASASIDFTVSRIYNKLSSDDGNNNFNQLQNLGCIRKIDAFTGTFQESTVPEMWEKCQEFPNYFGQIRVQMNPYLLKKGLNLKECVKEKLTDIDGNNNVLSLSVLDTYDNDEMVVLVFSDQIDALIHFLPIARCVTDNDGTALFNRCHITIGYCVDSVDKGRRLADIVDSHIGCTIEYIPGYFPTISKDDEYISLTGGSKYCTSHMKENIEDNGNGNILNKKLFFVYQSQSDQSSCPQAIDARSNKEGNQKCRIALKDIDKIRKVMRNIGISRALSERVLHLLYTFNNYSAFNFVTGLKNSILYLNAILIDLQIKNEPLSNMEKCLEMETSDLECALFNRIPTLTKGYIMQYYNGSSQQLLMACDRVYHEVREVLDPSDEANPIYACITSSQNVTSQRTHLNLNINHIIYPELFCSTIWKEAGNFFKLDNDVPNMPIDRIRAKKILLLFNLWKKDIGLDNLIKRVVDSKSFENFLADDFYRNTAIIISKNFNSKFIKEYLLVDNLVFHFAFAEDFKMACHFYIKLLLQTSSLYDSRGTINRSQVVMLLFRLSIIALRSNNIESFNDMACNPKDYLLAAIWHESFSQVVEIATKIFNILDSYGFREACDRQIWEIETRRYINFNRRENCPHWQNYKDDLDQYFANRSKITEELANTLFVYNKEKKDAFLNNWEIGKIIESYKENSDFIISFITAFLKKIYELDGSGANAVVVNSLPRDSCGDIKFPDIEEKAFSHILSDPTGGIYIREAQTRRDYFYLCSIFYKALWHYNCTTDKNYA